MSSFSARLGFGAALLAAVTFIIFTVCFVGIAVIGPLFVWTDLPDFVAHARAHDQTLVYVAQGCMAAFGPLFLVMASCLVESAPAERKSAVRAGLALAVGFAVLTGINYFSHITAVRFNIARGTTDGLEQFLQHKPDSVMAAINMLGWTIYFGLSSLLLSLAFPGSTIEGRLARAIRWVLRVNGVCCLLAGVGFVLDNAVLIFVSINLGMGGATLLACILLSVMFWRTIQHTENALTPPLFVDRQ